MLQVVSVKEIFRFELKILVLLLYLGHIESIYIL